jgi:hypothetical protein
MNYLGGHPDFLTGLRQGFHLLKAGHTAYHDADTGYNLSVSYALYLSSLCSPASSSAREPVQCNSSLQPGHPPKNLPYV